MTETWQQPSSSESWGKASGPRAGFWRRFAADIIDGIIIGVINFIVQLIIGAIAHHAVGIGYAVGFIISAAYFVSFEGSWRGAGIGKQAMGIRVIDANTGHPIGHPRAFVRWIASYLSTIVIFLGYLWMLWDPEKQCWHDKFAGDVVVPTADYPPARGGY